MVPRPIWRMLEWHAVCFPFCFARFKAGSSMEARMAMIAITTSSSINVKPGSTPPEARVRLLDNHALAFMRTSGWGAFSIFDCTLPKRKLHINLSNRICPGGLSANLTK
jgi:hypothetical protein